jgi:predicted Zn-dependent protease
LNNYTPRLPQTNHNVSESSPLRELAILLGGLLAVAIVLYLLLGFAVELLVPHITPTLEKRLSALLLNHYQANEEEDPQQLYLQQLINTMQEDNCFALPYPVRVHLVDTDSVNAAALPGGNILVYQGLLDLVDSENELCFVLGHEIGHFQNRDHLRGMGRGLVFALLSSLAFGPDNPVSRLVGQTVAVTEAGFSREQEADADTFGLQVLQCRYGHVGGATAFFEHMPEDLDPGRYGHYLSTHPENRRRITGLKTLSRELGYSDGPLTALDIPSF